MQEKALQQLKQQKDRQWATLDKQLEKFRQELLKAEDKRKGEDQAAAQDKSTRETLETMSSMAQKIDEDNQQLMKRNQELKIEFLTQDQDA